MSKKASSCAIHWRYCHYTFRECHQIVVSKSTRSRKWTQCPCNRFSCPKRSTLLTFPMLILWLTNVRIASQLWLTNGMTEVKLQEDAFKWRTIMMITTSFIFLHEETSFDSWLVFLTWKWDKRFACLSHSCLPTTTTIIIIIIIISFDALACWRRQSRDDVDCTYYYGPFPVKEVHSRICASNMLLWWRHGCWWRYLRCIRENKASRRRIGETLQAYQVIRRCDDNVASSS